MSHILAAKTSIVFPVKGLTPAESRALLDGAYALLAETLATVAQTSEPQTDSYRRHPAVTGVQDFILDWGGSETRREGQKDIRLGLFIKGITRGIGVYVDPATGELSFLGDKWGYDRAYDDLIQTIVRTHTALQLRSVLEQLGYEVEGAEEQGTVTLVGTAYA